MNQPVLFIYASNESKSVLARDLGDCRDNLRNTLRMFLIVYRKMKEDDKVSRAKNPKYESMSLEELKANMEKSRQELEVAIHNKNLLEQRKKLVERRERSHRLIVKGAEFEKAFPLSRDLEQEDVQNIMNQLQNSSYNKSIVRQTYISASQKDRQQIAEAVKKTEKGDDS